GTAVDDEKAKLGLVGLGLDYRQDNMRLSADLGYQNNELQKTRTNVTLSGLTRVPNAADAKSNWSQPWSYSNEKDVFGTIRAEYDLSPNLTAYGAYGFRHGEEENSLANLTVTNLNGDGTTYRFDNAREDDINTGEIGIRGKLTSGKINHNWVV
ncbi:TonB-dependent siderophore receptor, partial [Xanthomonas citri pv. citri]